MKLLFWRVVDCVLLHLLAVLVCGRQFAVVNTIVMI